MFNGFEFTKLTITLTKWVVGVIWATVVVFIISLLIGLLINLLT